MYKVMTWLAGEPEPGSNDNITRIDLLPPTSEDILELLLKRIGFSPVQFQKHFPGCNPSQVVEGLCAALMEEVVMTYAHALQDEYGSDLKPEHWQDLPGPVKAQMDLTWSKYGAVDRPDWPVYDRIIDDAAVMDEIKGRAIHAIGLGDARIPQPA